MPVLVNLRDLRVGDAEVAAIRSKQSEPYHQTRRRSAKLSPRRPFQAALLIKRRPGHLSLAFKFLPTLRRGILRIHSISLWLSLSKELY